MKVAPTNLIVNLWSDGKLSHHCDADNQRDRHPYKAHFNRSEYV